jgi:Ca2+/Na+ antiporter
MLAACVAMAILLKGFYTEIILAFLLCLVYAFGCSCLALSRDVKKPKLDWVTEQEAVKQNFGVLISMLISWGILAALAGLCYLMIDKGWEMLPVFGVLAAILTLIAVAAYKKLMKNVDKYYCAG